MLRLLVLAGILLQGLTCVSADERVDSTDRKSDPVADYLREQLRAMPHRIAGRNEPEIEFHATPLLRFFNPISGADGGVYLWTRNGLPLAVCKAHVNSRKDAFVTTMVSTTVEKLSMELPGGAVWTPASSACVGIEVDPEIEVPASPAVRLSHMKRIAGTARFEVSWYNDRNAPPQKYVLEMQSRPIFRYSAVKEGIVDGALFVFSQGTNPEGLMCVEAVQSGSRTSWRAAVAPLTTQGLKASYGERQALERPSSWHVAPKATEGVYQVVLRYPRDLASSPAP